MRKSVLVMGVGRSGTTALYSLLQEVLEQNFPGDVDYVYEPFLWDRTIFNDQYSEITSKFRFVPSVSIEGIYHHRQIPLLLSDDIETPAISRLWLKDVLTAGNGKKHYLGKMIRATGRVPLIHQISADTKIVFIVRNPIDVLNSSLRMFSFYGNEFHQSDLPRFAKNVSTVLHQDMTPPKGQLSEVEAEYLYWYYSNLAFIQFAKNHPENILSLSYESFVSQKSNVIERVCKFIGVEFDEKYKKISENTVGSVQNKFSSLTNEEYDYLNTKLDDYQELLEFVDISPDSNISTFVKYGKGAVESEPRNPKSFQYLNSFHANNKLEELQKKFQELQENFTLMENSKRARLINFLLSPLDRIRSWLDSRSHQ